MDFDLTEDQQSLAGLARDIFAGHATLARIEQVETSESGIDSALWSALAESGLLGTVIPEAHGGLGFGLVELSLVLQELGRAVAPVPLAWTSIAAASIARSGSEEQQAKWLPGLADGSLIATVALPVCSHGVSLTDGAVSGTLSTVAVANLAGLVLLSIGDELYAFDPHHSGVSAEAVRTTGNEPHSILELSSVPVEQIGSGAACWFDPHIVVALSSIQAGVTAAALKLAAEYTSQRLQFEKPLSTFQGVQLKAADAYIDAAAVRYTALQAAWRLDQGYESRAELLAAAWWAAEGGQHAVHITQHLHGGMGADVTYPVHRYFLWAKQIELELGGASAILAKLGDALLDLPNAGDELVLA